MGNIAFEVLEELEYNNILTLKVVESNELLNTIFVDEIKIPYEELYKLISSNKLDRVTEEYIQYVFNSGIKTDNKLIQKYKKLSEELNIPIANSNPIAVSEILEEVDEIEEIETPIEEVPTGKTKVVKYPRRFGKEKVNAQIADQGEVTLAQTAMLRSNDLKNLYVRMDKLLIKALHSEEHALTNTEYLAIISTVNIVENKFKAIFKKHKNDPK